MKTILFSPATANLAETTRAIVIAKAIAADFDCQFITYGGPFEGLIEKAGFPLTRLEPCITPQLIDHIYKIDQGKKIGAIIPAEIVRQQVVREIDLLRTMRPAAVVTGFNFSSIISCPVTNTPLIWVIQSSMRMISAARSGAYRDLDLLAVPPVRWLPPDARAALSVFLITRLMGVAMSAFNKVAREYGVPPFVPAEEVFRSPYHLVAEPPGFSNLPVLSTFRYVGPLIARLDEPVPDDVLNLPKDKPIVYFAMGSSGQAEIIARIIAGFEGKPYRVIAPVKSLLRSQALRIPDNVLVTDWLPAHLVNPLADISVIHGGIGTIMTACLAGKPVVGVAMQPEQQANLDNLVRKGFAVRIPKGRLTPERLCTEIDRLLADAVAQQKAKDYQQVIQEWDDPRHVRQFFQETFGAN